MLSNILLSLSKLGNFEQEQAGQGTVQGIFEGVKFSLFLYSHKLLKPAHKYLYLDIADIQDIAAEALYCLARIAYAQENFVPITDFLV